MAPCWPARVRAGGAEVVDRQIQAPGCFAGGAVSIHQVADAHMVGVVAREQQAVRSLAGVLQHNEDCRPSSTR